MQAKSGVFPYAGKWGCCLGGGTLDVDLDPCRILPKNRRRPTLAKLRTFDMGARNMDISRDGWGDISGAPCIDGAIVEAMD